MIRLISKHTGQPVEAIENDSQRDRWFSAEEARDYGIIDHIVERVEDVRPAAGERAYDIYSRLLSERSSFSEPS
jgi:ATP-dependent Clp protease protease subunit